MMKTPRVTYNQRDLNNAKINNQETIGGTAEERKRDSADFFILGVYNDGTNPVTLKDKDSATEIIIHSQEDLHNVLRFDGGFEFTCATTAYIVFCSLEKNQGV